MQFNITATNRHTISIQHACGLCFCEVCKIAAICFRLSLIFYRNAPRAIVEIYLVETRPRRSNSGRYVCTHVCARRERLVQVVRGTFRRRDFLRHNEKCAVARGREGGEGGGQGPSTMA